MRRPLALVALIGASFFLPRASRALDGWMVPVETADGFNTESREPSTLQKGTPTRPPERIDHVAITSRRPDHLALGTHAPASASQLQLLAVESQPTYLKIRLLGMPKSHRAPPSA
jgi:hypothetical protein